MSSFAFKSPPIFIIHKKDFRITSPFGPRQTGIAGASTYHKGIDIGRNWNCHGTSCLAVADGQVIEATFNDYRGNYIKLYHKDGYSTIYQHLKNFAVSKNEVVKAGQHIGMMGNTTNQAVLKVAVHLHFELLYRGVPIDPEPYFDMLWKEEWIDMTKSETIELINEYVTKKLIGTTNEPASWAKDAWETMVEEKILDGAKANGYVTRQQLAVVLEKLLKR